MELFLRLLLIWNSRPTNAWGKRCHVDGKQCRALMKKHAAGYIHVDCPAWLLELLDFSVVL